MPCPIYSPKHFRRNTIKKGYRARYPFCVMINCRTRHAMSLQIPAIRFCASSEEIAVLPDAIPFPIPIADLLRRDFFQNRFVDLEQFAVLFQLHINALALERFPVTAGDLLRIHPQAHYGLAVVIARPAVDIQFQRGVQMGGQVLVGVQKAGYDAGNRSGGRQTPAGLLLQVGVGQDVAVVLLVVVQIDLVVISGAAIGAESGEHLLFCCPWPAE